MNKEGVAEAFREVSEMKKSDNLIKWGPTWENEEKNNPRGKVNFFSQRNVRAGVLDKMGKIEQ